MTLRGIIENGRVVFPKPVELPDGTIVDVTPSAPTRAKRGRKQAIDPLARLASHAVKTGVRDLARRHTELALRPESTAPSRKRTSPQKRTKRPASR